MHPLMKKIKILLTKLFATKKILVAKKLFFFYLKNLFKFKIALVYFFIQTLIGYLIFNFLALYFFFGFVEAGKTSNFTAFFVIALVESFSLELYLINKFASAKKWVEMLINDDAFILKYFNKSQTRNNVLKAYFPVFFWPFVNSFSIYHQLNNINYAIDLLGESLCETYYCNLRNLPFEVKEDYRRQAAQMLGDDNCLGILKKIMQRTNLEDILENWKNLK